MSSGSPAWKNPRERLVKHSKRKSKYVNNFLLLFLLQQNFNTISTNYRNSWWIWYRKLPTYDYNCGTSWKSLQGKAWNAFMPQFGINFCRSAHQGKREQNLMKKSHLKRYVSNGMIQLPMIPFPLLQRLCLSFTLIIYSDLKYNRPQTLRSFQDRKACKW